VLSRLIGRLRNGLRWGWCVLPIVLALPNAIPAQSPIALGNATVELTGPWRFHTGDDPAWAQPEFVDSAWSTMDLTPPEGSYDPYRGINDFVPGWTAHGYPGYSGFAWYRLRVKLREPVAGGLAIKMPQDVDDAYQLYVNGQLIGEFGRFRGEHVTNYIAQPRAFTLPADTGGGPITIAIRMWMDPHTPLVESAAGGLHGTPILGQTQAVMATLRLEWDALNRSQFSELLVAAILLLAIAVTFSLFALDRTEPAYLWLGVNCIVMLLLVCVRPLAYHGTWITAMQAIFLRDVILFPIEIALWIFFWACWFRLDEMKRLRVAVWVLVALLAVGTAMLRAPLYGRLVPLHSEAWVSPLVLGLKLLLGAELLWVTYRGVLKDRTEGLLALPAVALIVIAQYQYELRLFHAPIFFFAFGYNVSVSQIGTVLSLAIVTVLLLRRFIHAQRVREQWRLEIDQAQQVQQVLIPDAIPAIPGFVMESEYRPSQQVGGDFFQIIPGADGSILAVIGDVSGKGLRAAMLVSLIVGAVRTLARFTRDPEEVLRGVNERLCGHLKNQFATCLALHIASDGKTTIANAGHLPPFWNGRELDMAGSIPLGIVENAPIEQSTLLLSPGDRLILLTDGIVEAQNKQRELFGFVRLGELAREDRSSVEIAAAAQEFGQEDDITVLRIQRVGIDTPSALRNGEENAPLAGVLEYS
jgi:Stage II sporulation protein E (SpoIIE)